VRWAIQEGVADANRICIYGGSFGAYSALVGVSREPTMFKCAVGMAGVYDLPLLYSRGDVEKSRRGVNFLKDAVGDDEKDLQARSPVYSARSITAKVLLLHGADDFRAPLEHAKRMREALVEAGNPPEWIVEGGEDHGFSNPENRVSAYTRILEFIDRNIGH
jgi:dipeptidyl aminopeptidase/acylaminoacyl peptidase